MPVCVIFLPFHYQQIVSYIIWLFYAYSLYFIALIAFKPHTKLRHIFLYFYTLLFLAIAMISIIATLLNPTDTIVLYEKEMVRQGYF